MKLYHHKTSGGAEYLTDTFVVCPNGDKEGTIREANYIVRIDGDIKKDAELTIRSEPYTDIKKQIKDWELRIDELIINPDADKALQELENISHEMMAINI
ncbi:MAG: hypothetical protein WBO77_04450 [Microgenomates group bacterium]